MWLLSDFWVLRHGKFMKNLFKYLKNDYIPWAFWPFLLSAIILGLTAGLLSYSAEVGALIFTAVFIAWYSIETSKLVKETKGANFLVLKTRKEMTLANQLSIQPALILEYKGVGLLNLKNIGRGAAMNIRIDSHNPEYNFELSSVNAMGSGEEKEVKIKRNGSDLSSGDNLSLERSPIIATIFFERTKKFKGRIVELRTKIEIKNSPNSKIIDKYWIPN